MEMTENNSLADSFNSNFKSKVEYSFTSSKSAWKIPKNVLYSVLAAVGLSLIVNTIIILLFISGGTIQFHNHEPSSNFPTSPSVSSCGNWQTYSDVKCFKVINKMETYDEAVELCRSADPAASLLNIQTAAEQTYLEKYIFGELRLFNSVWLGKRSFFNAGGNYTLLNETNILYSNWAKGNPSDQATRECTQMLADHHAEVTGSWVSVRCEQKGAVVCQRLQSWSLPKYQDNLLKTMMEMDELKKVGSVPVGFVYVQLPKEESPAKIWPRFAWKDISAVYAGVFFRVIGEESADFGAFQNESSPRLTRVSLMPNSTETMNLLLDSVKPGEWSRGVSVKTPFYHSQKDDDSIYLQFYVSNKEVRPKNMAIKVWKRV